MRLNQPPGDGDTVPPPRIHRESLAPGARLDEFDIIRAIGIGGFGAVYLARDRILEREVAIKEFLPAQLACRGTGQHVTVREPSLAGIYAEGLRSFVHEARLLAQINHPAIIKVHRFWEANGTAYMAMPFVRGPTLRDARRAMSRPPDEAWLRGLLSPLLDALETLHAHGIYHRDIAPDNILLPAPGAPVLLDFGAARQLVGGHTRTLTAVLKPSYAPIEQYAESSALRQGPWTDLYALGAVVSFMLNAAAPPPSTVRAVEDDDPSSSWSDDMPGVSSTFVAAIRWALAVRPQDRPQTVAELRDAIEGRLQPRRPQRAANTIRHESPSTSGEAAATPAVPPQDPITEPARGSPYRSQARDAAPPSLRGTPSHAGTVREPSTWDTTLQLRSRGADGPSLAFATALQQRAGPPAWLLACAAGAACIVVAAGMAVLFGVRGAEPALDTWRELARQAAPDLQARADQLLRMTTDDEPAAPRLAPASDEIDKPAPAQALPPPPAPETVAMPALAHALATDAGDKSVRGGAPHARATAHHRRHARAALDPHAACADRGFFMAAICVHLRCVEPAYARHPSCVAMRKREHEHAQEMVRR